MRLQKAPAHYPCDRAKSGVSMSIMPNVGWSNAVPDAVAEVHIEVNGTKVDFSGVGYHDSAIPKPSLNDVHTDRNQRIGAMCPS
jgi:hypothetical protein